MDTTSKPKPTRADSTKLAPNLGHLLIPDTRTPEERNAASIRESNRRKGRARGKWWEQGGS